MNHPYQNLWGEPKIGEDCNIAAFVEIGRDVIIGDRVMIEAFTFIPSGVTIEDYAFIGPHVVFTNDRKPPTHGKEWAKTLVRRGASIGANCTILPGVTIGEKSVLGAGSVLTKDLPNGETWVGNPAAKLIQKEPPQSLNDY